MIKFKMIILDSQTQTTTHWPHNLVVEINQAVSQAGGAIDFDQGRSMRTLRSMTPAEVIITLGSAGVFTALYQVIVVLEDIVDKQ